MKAYIASIPLHILVAVQMLKQEQIDECDLYYVPTSNNARELMDSVEKSGLFQTVTVLPNINIEYPISAKQCIKIAYNRFKVRKRIRNKEYDEMYFNTDGWLLNSIVFSSLKKRVTKNYFVENGINPYIVPYDSKEWYLRLFINANFMTCMDGRFITRRFVFKPELICVPQSGEINRIESIDKGDKELVERVNLIFGYDEKLDNFAEKEIIILEQGPRKEPIDMKKIWGKVSENVPVNKTIIKAHPRQKGSVLKEIGIDIYDRYVIPWEVLTLNQNMNEKTLISIFSTACVNPKIMFGEEPRVILLYKLIGIDYHFFGKGLIDFVEKVGELYSDKSKFFIPETWKDFEEYCKKNLF